MTSMLAAQVTEVLNAALEAVDYVIPGVFHRGVPSLLTAPLSQPEFGVLVGITGVIRGTLFISAAIATFAQIGEVMYGIELDGTMVQSFAAEFCNMIAGNMSRLAEKLNLDISPPTTLEGGTRLSGFHRAIMVPLNSDKVATLHLALMLENV
ncbi:MAG: chemotaxis protein CheX [Alicyclobacillus sp.]|nr:chemotaxis protein CheX [Alicyclobacillus sp.]